MKTYNTRKSIGARSIKYVDRNQPGAEKHMDVTTMNYPLDDKRSRPNEPEVTKVRKFDQIADFISVKNITGADPVFGKETSAHNIVFDTQGKAILGLDHETNYLANKYSLVSHRDRNIIHFLRGISLASIPAANDPTPLSIVAQNSYISKMINVLNTNLYTEEEKLPLQVEYSPTAPTGTDHAIQAEYVGSDAIVTEMANRRLSPVGAMILGYETEYHALASFLVQYKLLVAMLPKLATRYYPAQNQLNWLQGQLKRAAVTSQIQALESTIKRRYVDKTSLNRVAKTLGVSADTEGINSSIDSLTQHFHFLNGSVVNKDDKGVERNATRIPLTPMFGYILRKSQLDAGQTLGAVSLGKVNMWEIGEVITNAMLDAQNGNQVETEAMLKAWLDVLASLYGRISYWEKFVLKIEGLYARLTSLQVGFNQVQGLQIGDVLDVERMVDDKFITGLFSLPVTEAISSDSNGFTYKAPIYRQTGMHINSVEEGFQQYFLPSDHKSIAWGEVGTQIRVELRHVRHQHVMTQSRSNGDIHWEVDLTSSPLEIAEATTLMFSDIPRLIIKKGATTVELRNPELMGLLTLRHRYNSPEVQRLLWSQQPIAVA